MVLCASCYPRPDGPDGVKCATLLLRVSLIITFYVCNRFESFTSWLFSTAYCLVFLTCWKNKASNAPYSWNKILNELMLSVSWRLFACVNLWWVWLMRGSVASTWCCWCVWRLFLSVDRQCGNMSGIILTHQPTDCMTSTLRLTHPASRHCIKY